MPIRISQNPAKDLINPPEQFLIFYSSIVDGRSWCPDCRDVEDLVEQTFGPEASPSALIIYVGDRPSWKSLDNTYRAEPWKLTDIPTIIRLRNGVEHSRIVEKDIAGGLGEFLRE